MPFYGQTKASKKAANRARTAIANASRRSMSARGGGNEVCACFNLLIFA